MSRAARLGHHFVSAMEWQFTGQTSCPVGHRISREGISKLLYLLELRTGRKQEDRKVRELSQGLNESETKRFRLKRSRKGLVFESRQHDAAWSLSGRSVD